MQTNHSGNFKDLHNSCETYGGMNGINEVDKGMDSSNQLDTEPGEVYDEATPCGCSHSKYVARTSIIPEDKLKSLHKQSSFITMRSVIQKHLRNFIRKQIFI